MDNPSAAEKNPQHTVEEEEKEGSKVQSNPTVENTQSSNPIRDLLRLLFFSRDAAPKIKALLHYDFLRKIISEVGERGNDLFR